MFHPRDMLLPFWPVSFPNIFSRRGVKVPIPAISFHHILDMQTKPTLVLGASTNPYRYAHRAIEMLVDAGHDVMALGNRHGEVRGVPIHTDHEALSGQPVHTLTLYLNPSRQVPFYDHILAWKPQRVIFNPGTENPDLAQRLQQAGIQPIYACTLVMLSTGQY